MAKMGLSVRDNPPKVVDLTIRAWGEAREGLVLSVGEIPREDPESLPRISVVIRNVSSEPKTFAVPGWLFFYRVDVMSPEGSVMELSPFGRALLKPERRTEHLQVAFGPGEFHETEIPIGSLYNLRARGRYSVRASCEPFPGVPLTSNEILVV